MKALSIVKNCKIVDMVILKRVLIIEKLIKLSRWTTYYKTHTSKITNKTNTHFQNLIDFLISNLSERLHNAAIPLTIFKLVRCIREDPHLLAMEPNMMYSRKNREVLDHFSMPLTSNSTTPRIFHLGLAGMYKNQ